MERVNLRANQQKILRIEDISDKRVQRTEHSATKLENGSAHEHIPYIEVLCCYSFSQGHDNRNRFLQDLFLTVQTKVILQLGQALLRRGTNSNVDPASWI